MFQTKNKEKKGVKIAEVDESNTTEDDTELCVAKKVYPGPNISQRDIMNELRNVGTSSLRHVKETERASKSNPGAKQSVRAGNISAQLPSNTPVLKLLERRLKESDEQNLVTTIKIEHPPKEELQSEVVNANPTNGENEPENNKQINTGEKTESAPNISTVTITAITNETDQSSREGSQDKENKMDVEPETTETTGFTASPTPSESGTLLDIEGKNVTKRKPSFLSRVLRGKDKKPKEQEKKFLVPIIKIEECDAASPYETIDYEAMIEAEEMQTVSSFDQNELHSLTNNNSSTEIMSDHANDNIEKQIVASSQNTNIAEQNDKNRNSPALPTPIITSCTDSNITHQIEGDIQKTVINLTCINQVPLHQTHGQQKESNSDKSFEKDSKISSTDDLKNKIIFLDNRLESVTNNSAHRHKSVDELDILLLQLTKITYAPLQSASMNSLVPLKIRRNSSEPDYDIPRPHKFSNCCNTDPKGSSEFFTNSNSLCPLNVSTYLSSTKRTSHITESRTVRAFEAMNKWQQNREQLPPSETTNATHSEQNTILSIDDEPLKSDVTEIVKNNMTADRNTTNNELTSSVIVTENGEKLKTEANAEKDLVTENVTENEATLEIHNVEEICEIDGEHKNEDNSEPNMDALSIDLQNDLLDVDTGCAFKEPSAELQQVSCIPVDKVDASIDLTLIKLNYETENNVDVFSEEIKESNEFLPETLIIDETKPVDNNLCSLTGEEQLENDVPNSEQIEMNYNDTSTAEMEPDDKNTVNDNKNSDDSLQEDETNMTDTCLPHIVTESKQNSLPDLNTANEKNTMTTLEIVKVLSDESSNTSNNNPTQELSKPVENVESILEPLECSLPATVQETESSDAPKSKCEDPQESSENEVTIRQHQEATDSPQIVDNEAENQNCQNDKSEALSESSDEVTLRGGIGDQQNRGIEAPTHFRISFALADTELVLNETVGEFKLSPDQCTLGQ
jgi:hypothetical protein